MSRKQAQQDKVFIKEQGSVLLGFALMNAAQHGRGVVMVERPDPASQMIYLPVAHVTWEEQHIQTFAETYRIDSEAVIVFPGPEPRAYLINREGFK